MPTVSVIIPAYNAEAFISETVTSALNQTFSFKLIGNAGNVAAGHHHSPR